MKKYLQLLLILCLVSSVKNSFGQGGVWTWLNGTDTLNAPASFGIQGVPSSINHPPATYEGCEWNDRQGNFYLYGGDIGTYNHCDLWKYNPVTNEWTWIYGTGTANHLPVYGTLGVSNPANHPGWRSGAVPSWIDTSGNFWLFGGNVQFQNDLWKYDINTNEWTWMSGTNWHNGYGVYGVKGVPGILNHPGGRWEGSCAWTDSLNNLWLFGGNGYATTGSNQFLNDLWKYDIGTGEWTWMKGDSIVNVPAAYGTRNISAATNDPGGRSCYARWKDKQENFWLMGGAKYAATLNDLWKYDSAINEWTWMSGANASNDSGNYNSNCTWDTINQPRCRRENRSSVTDYCGRFWMFGGFTVISSQAQALNDLWIYDPMQQSWKLPGGNNFVNNSGNYGIKGVASASNIPPSRMGANAWWGNDNRFYLYGGYISSSNSYLADLWVFTPDTNCITFSGCEAPGFPPNSSFTTSVNTICPGTCIDFINLSSNASSYQWYFPNALPDTSTTLNPQSICYATPGNYDVQLIASNPASGGSDTLLLTNYITVYPFPPPQSITQSSDTLFAITGSASYQWYFNTNLISGATAYFYVAQASGDYNVVATDVNGCEVEAAIFNVVADLQSTVDRGLLTIFPNPVEDKFTIHNAQCMMRTAIEISIYNVLGEKMEVDIPSTDRFQTYLEIDVHTLHAGLYYLGIKSSGRIFRTKFVKQ